MARCNKCGGAISVVDVGCRSCVPPHVRVGVAVLVWKVDGAGILWCLMHERGDISHCPGAWASAGGHLEYGETWEQCAVREVAEEAGPDLWISPPRYWDTVDTLFPGERRHYVTIFMQARWLRGEARVMEPEKCRRWDWVRWDAIPRPTMLGNLRMLEKHGPRPDFTCSVKLARLYVEMLPHVVEERMADAEMDSVGCSLGHIKWMCGQILNGRIVGPRADRWMGFVQGVLAASSVPIFAHRRITREAAR